MKPAPSMAQSVIGNNSTVVIRMDDTNELAAFRIFQSHQTNPESPHESTST